MLRTLSRRLIVSHILPVVVIIPLLGLALVYVLETQVLLPHIADELAGEAELVAEMASTRPGIWVDSGQAQAFVDRIGSHLDARLALLDPAGRLLASSDPADGERLGQDVEAPGLVEALAGGTSVRTTYSPGLHDEVADALLVVRSADRRVLGMVRVSHRIATVYDDFARLRYLIAAVLVVGLLLGAVVGSALALDLVRPLRRVIRAMEAFSGGKQTAPLPEKGPEETALLARSFNTLAEQLRAAEESRRQLLANLVHELGRPMGAVRSAVQALQSGADKEPALRRELLAGIDGEVATLQRVLDDLSHLNDLLIGNPRVARRPTALTEWLDQSLATWQRAAQAKDLHWEARVPDSLPVLQVDPDRLDQALGNLLSNAIKYTPAGGTVTVAADVEPAAVWIRVSDSGAGIAPEEQAAIFTAFYRGSAAGRFPRGMGLGLTIARDLVAAHGGHLEVASTPGAGSQFTIYLPLTT